MGSIISMLGIVFDDYCIPDEVVSVFSTLFVLSLPIASILLFIRLFTNDS